LIPHNVKVESIDYLGKRAVKITEESQVANGEAYAIVKDTMFHDVAIEVELAGRPAPGRRQCRARLYWSCPSSSERSVRVHLSATD
jgi:hypothetical protein